MQSIMPTNARGDAEPGDVARQRPKRTRFDSQFIVVDLRRPDRRGQRVEDGDATLGFCGDCDDRRRSLRAKLQRCVTCALSAGVSDAAEMPLLPERLSRFSGPVELSDERPLATYTTGP